MNNDLYDKMKEYKEISDTIYQTVNFEHYEELDELFSKRQNIIDRLKEMDYSKEEFTKICSELGIMALEEKINTLMLQRKEYLKKQITHLKTGVAASKYYNKKSIMNSVLFNKKY